VGQVPQRLPRSWWAPARRSAPRRSPVRVRRDGLGRGPLAGAGRGDNRAGGRCRTPGPLPRPSRFSGPAPHRPFRQRPGQALRHRDQRGPPHASRAERHAADAPRRHGLPARRFARGGDRAAELRDLDQLLVAPVRRSHVRGQPGSRGSAPAPNRGLCGLADRYRVTVAPQRVGDGEACFTTTQSWTTSLRRRRSRC